MTADAPEPVEYTALDDMRRIEAYLRETVVIQPDGRLKPRIPKDVMDAIISTVLTDRRDYTRVHCPALAIYAESFFDVHAADPQWRHDALAWEQKYMAPFRAKSIDRVRRELANVEIVRVPGTHEDFVFTSRKRVVGAMRRFLSEPIP